MERGTKAITVPRLKAGVEDGLNEGEALAMVSLYGLRDHDGDRVKAGAFDAFAEAFDPKATPLPMVFQHGRGVFDYVGEVISLDPKASDEKGRDGLAVRVGFDVDSEIPEARSSSRQAYKLVKGRRVSQWSYAWEGDTEPLADGSRELTNMKLSEVSPVLRGALSETSTLGVKEPTGALAALGGRLPADVAAWLEKAEDDDLDGLAGSIVAYRQKLLDRAEPKARLDPAVAAKRLALVLS